MRFADRDDAGRRLGAALEHYRGRDAVVLGLPRGGVPVAAQVAVALDKPLDVVIVRKLGVPGQPELAMGAVGEGGVTVLNDDVLRIAGVTTAQVDRAATRERAEVEQRAQRFRAGRDNIPLRGRVAIVVDDGVATGATARAACQVARAHGAARVVLAVPVGAPDTLAGMQHVADEVVCLHSPGSFWAVGAYYRDFDQVPDDDVVRLLRR
jgi:putative phosphoribosyl transferase